MATQKPQQKHGLVSSGGPFTCGVPRYQQQNAALQRFTVIQDSGLVFSLKTPEPVSASGSCVTGICLLPSLPKP
jgi:hypothetical protein